ncbi:hypothetical protein MMC07_006862 [Pseudocyphellaria aurata]|nr:hypothetical protein [Pseudocyphellaria aurata]
MAWHVAPAAATTDEKCQPEVQARMDQLTLNDPKHTGGSVNSQGLTVEQMEAELDSIEAERRSVTLARRLAAAKEEQARGFPEAGTLPMITSHLPQGPAALVAKRADSVRGPNIYKEKAQLRVPKLSMYKVLKSYKDIRQRSGESIDSLIDRINALEAQMSPQPEQYRIHTLLFALHLSTQDEVLTRQSHFATRDELQKVAVQVEALETKKKNRRDRDGRIENGAGSERKKSNGRDDRNYMKGASHAPSRVSKTNPKPPVTGANAVAALRERRSKDRKLSHITCLNCDQPGHYLSVCPKPNEDRSKENVELIDVAAVLRNHPQSNEYRRIVATVALAIGTEIYHLVALLDTRAASNFISQKVVRDLGLGNGQVMSRSFRFLSGQPLHTHEQHHVRINAVDSRSKSVDTTGNFIAAEFVGFDIILGLPWLTRWNANIQVGCEEWWFNETSDVTALSTTNGGNHETVVSPSHGWVVEILDPIDDLISQYRVGQDGDMGADIAM